MRPVSESLKEYARGITGGLLFSLPLLYTMEVWWTGFSVQYMHLLIYLTVTFLLLMGYNKYAGMHEGATLKDILIDSVEEIGIGFVLALLALWMLGQINFSMGLQEIMGKTIVETMSVAIGVSVGTAQLGSQVAEDEQNSRSSLRDATEGSTLARSVLAFCGSILIAGNVAPTEEVPMIAFETTPFRLVAMVVITLLLGAVILFFSNFKGGRKLDANNIVVNIIAETALTYVIAVISSTFMLWFFGRFEQVSFDAALCQVVVLSFPGMLGASAGRLLIK
jgi:putative integral membrane protein (TIGR02587 family)